MRFYKVEEKEMPAPYSNDMRCKVLEAYQNGEGSVEEVASNFGVSTSFVDRLLKRYRETGLIDPKPPGQGNPPSFTEEDCTKLKSYLQDNPDATLKEMRDYCGVDCSLETVSQTLKRLGITRKKNAKSIRTGP
jgi:transposase